MKIIHIAGRSGSGKTTFIRELCPALLPFGRVGTIKHLGHHSFTLPPGKDSTLHFETGAYAGAAIDEGKSVITVRTADLEEAMELLSDMGIELLVIEGFKAYPFTKILIGDMEGDPLLRNPTVKDVIAHLDDFDDFYSVKGLIRALEGEDPRPIPVLSAVIPVSTCEDQLFAALPEFQKKVEEFPGLTGKIHIQKIHQGKCNLLIAVRGRDVCILADAIHQLSGAIAKCIKK